MSITLGEKAYRWGLCLGLVLWVSSRAILRMGISGHRSGLETCQREWRSAAYWPTRILCRRGSGGSGSNTAKTMP